MKKGIIILKLMFLVQNLFSQATNFFVDNSVWTYISNESFEFGMLSVHNIFEKDSINGDTTINNLTYKKLFVKRQINTFPQCTQCPSVIVGSIDSSISYIRYDTLIKKVFIREDTSTTERCIYDLNLNIGDTVIMEPASGFPPYTIDSIENTIFFGKSVKKFYLPGGNFGDNFIIEGLGGSNGLISFFPIEFVVSGGFISTSLNCFQSGDSIYNPDFGGCISFFLTVSIDENNLKNQVKIYPNPNLGLFELNVDAPFQNAEFTIFSLTGEIVIQQKITQNKTKLNLLSHPKGMYLYQLNADGKQIVDKLIIH